MAVGDSARPYAIVCSMLNVCDSIKNHPVRFKEETHVRKALIIWLVEAASPQTAKAVQNTGLAMHLSL